MNQDIEKLLAHAAEGDLDEMQAAELLRHCREDEELGHRLIRLTQINRLAGLAIGYDEEIFIREFSCRLEAEEEAEEFSAVIAQRLRRKKVIKMVTGIAAILLISLIGFGIFINKGRDVTAIVLRAEAADLTSRKGRYEVGDRIVFERGVIELSYLSGVSVMIEAPADFEITGRNSGYLHEGKLVAEVDDQRARGFTIDGPSGRVVDLGTKFAVAVQQSGEMEVHVLEGLVDATATGGETFRLGKNEAMRIADGETSSMKIDSGKFVTRLPDYRNQPPRYVRWGFDEVEGGIVRDTGNGLSAANAEGRLISYSGRGPGPQSVKGLYGNGLSFDGEDSFVESDFKGIVGSGPRSVAFWVKAPRDFDRLQGYGIINWGDVKEPGGAWQISINATESEGPMGRLRVGTHWGQVVGTTDLRDSEWHHCVVVMYGDELGTPNTATHIFLYVDGKLEPAARKSVVAVDTVLIPEESERSHGVWMGRNLGYEHEGAQSGEIYGRFFRGDLDEMMIFDAALSPKQILRLMKENEAP